MATKADWRKRLAEWRASGETRDHFAAKHGYDSLQLQWWVSKIARDDAQGSMSSPAVRFAKVSKRTTSPRQSRAPRRARATRSIEPVSDSGVAVTPMSLEIVLPRGLVVRVSSGFDPRALSAVIDLLEVR